jgi:signal transduction histidine kinase
VELSLYGGEEYVSVTISDDGKGFDAKQSTRRGLGLVGIEERVRELGGKTNILSQACKGTLLEVEIPVGSEVQI